MTTIIYSLKKAALRMLGVAMILFSFVSFLLACEMRSGVLVIALCMLALASVMFGGCFLFNPKNWINEPAKEELDYPYEPKIIDRQHQVA